MIEHTEIQTSEQGGLWHYVEKYKPQIENTLREFLPQAPAKIKTRFNEAAEYALFPGGKRLRPILTLLGAELVGGTAESVLQASITVEYVHTSSLIFDDLPSMDNAPERRGKASLHEKFGEGLAVLVGLGFLNASYGLVFANPEISPKLMIAAHTEIIDCIGASGMVGGQAFDLALAKDADQVSNTEESYDTESIRNLKTSALMRLALRVGAILADANEAQLEALSRFAILLGDAYQLSDDLIDLKEDEEIFNQSQSTYAISQGQDKAQNQLNNLVTEAKKVLLDNFQSSEAQKNLAQLADYLAERGI